MHGTRVGPATGAAAAAAAAAAAVVACVAAAGCTARNDVVFELTVLRGELVQEPAAVDIAAFVTARDPDAAGDDVLTTGTTVERAWPLGEDGYVLEFLLGPDALSIDVDVVVRDAEGRVTGRAGSSREFPDAGRWSATIELQAVAVGTDAAPPDAGTGADAGAGDGG